MSDNAPQIFVADPTLALIVAQVESGGFSGALRFEPSVYASVKDLGMTDIVKDIARVNRCTLETAQVIYSMSFGLYQVMGYNLYRLGLSRPVSEFLAGAQARILQDMYFAKFLADRNIGYAWGEMLADPLKLNRFSEHYNGSVSYGERLLTVARALKAK
jgi:hypothetical protein